MLYSELYGAYYNCVAGILRIALDHAPSLSEMEEVIRKKGFAESSASLINSLRNEEFMLIRKDGSTPISKDPSMPLTSIQKMWLKAVSLDPRYRLFGEPIEELKDVPPLFYPEDIDYFDRYLDGDDYSDPVYRAHFKAVLEAVREGRTICVKVPARSGRTKTVVFRPDIIEYSSKDDKFRALGVSRRGNTVINMNKIISVTPSEEALQLPEARFQSDRLIEFELIDLRNALERVMFGFAHFEKEVIKQDDKRYLVRIKYDRDDETELIIRIMSFGPMIKVTKPSSAVNEIRNRLSSQLFFRDNKSSC